MRVFSKKEKNYIDILCEKTKSLKSSYLVINMIEEVLKKEKAGYTTKTDYLVFYRDVDVDYNEIIEVENKILEVALLLEYLEKNGLIMYVQDNSLTNKDEQTYFGFDNKIEKLTPRKKRVSNVIIDQLTKASEYRIYVGETLRKFVEDGFKTMEELQLDEARTQSKTAIESLDEARTQSRTAIESLNEARIQSEKAIESLEEAKKQTRWSIGAVVVAVITMFVTIGFQVYCTQSVLVEDVKPSVIQTVKKEVLPKPAVEQKDVSNVEKPNKEGAKTTLDNDVKNKGKKSQQ